jgi:hypothetical protein
MKQLSLISCEGLNMLTVANDNTLSIEGLKLKNPHSENGLCCFVVARR